jgi:hypothetical protein
VTAAQGVAVTQAAGASRLAYGDAPMDTYTVTTGESGGTLTFRVPYWPGLRAALDGHPLATGAVDGAVLQVRLPAGVSARTLTISYVPLGERILVPALVASLILTLAAFGIWVVSGRRQQATEVSSGKVERSQDEAEEAR